MRQSKGQKMRQNMRQNPIYAAPKNPKYAEICGKKRKYAEILPKNGDFAEFCQSSYCPKKLMTFFLVINMVISNFWEIDFAQNTGICSDFASTFRWKRTTTKKQACQFNAGTKSPKNAAKYAVKLDLCGA